MSESIVSGLSPAIHGNASSKQPDVSAPPEAIALIGIGCRFPGGANTPDAFWQLLHDGVDAVRPMPSTRWDVEKYYDPDRNAPGKMVVREGAFLNDEEVTHFDARFFRMAPREAASLDPQQRLLLEVSWEALEHAGQSPAHLEGSRTGVFVGSFWDDYSAERFYLAPLRQVDAFTTISGVRAMAAGRIAHALNLHGPTLQLDTACSSSLLAVHLASQALRNAECDLALAGGVSLILSPRLLIGNSRMNALSNDGRCRAFAANTTGFGRAEGCGIVVLKRYSDAVRDGDTILACLRGSAVNHDGRSLSLTTPNVKAQQMLLQAALTNAGVEADQIQYLEAHGTGTPLGDPIELAAIGQVFGPARPTPLLVGSVKANIGHLDPAAGVSGLIKVVLSMQHGAIPPQLHFDQPNPLIPWDRLPVTIPTTLTPWSAQPKLAGVSAFGLSGTNVHVIVEEAPQPVTHSILPERSYHLLTLSAKSEQALQDLTKRYADHLTTDLTADLGDMCYTAATGRSHFEHRIALLANSTSQLREQLDTVINGKKAEGIIRPRRGQESKKPRIAFLFTGQGSQYVNMGRQLYATHPLFRRIIDQCDEILRPYLAESLRSVLYPDDLRSTIYDLRNEGTSNDGSTIQDAREETASSDHQSLVNRKSEIVNQTSAHQSLVNRKSEIVNQTRYAQPALFAIEYALAQVWKSWGIQPDVVLGHSTGEYVAACVAGVFSLEDGLKLVATRARLIESVSGSGATAAVLADVEQVRSLLLPYANQVGIAGINGPLETLIAGDAATVEEVLAMLAAAGLESRRLQIPHAPHSPLMEPILAEFEALAQQVTYHPPQCKFISNVTGGVLASIDAHYWRRHMREPVRFIDGMNQLVTEGCNVMLEVGPQPVLQLLGRQNWRGPKGVRWLGSLWSAQEDWAQLLQSAGELYVQGAKLDWARFEREAGAIGVRRKVTLPTYPFQRERHWTDVPDASTQQAADETYHPLLGRPLHAATLREGELLFTRTLSRNAPAYLQDHRAYERVLLPATAYIEMALAFGTQQLHSDQLVVEQLSFQRALLLPEDGTRQQVQWLATPARAGYRWQVYAAPDAKPDLSPTWTRHAEGAVRTVDGATLAAITNAVAPLNILQQAIHQPVDPATLYAHFAQVNLQYGPHFRLIRQLWRNADRALGQIQLSQPLAQEADQYQIHPALLDACLQVSALLFLDEERAATTGEVYLPVGIDQFIYAGRLGQKPLTELWCAAQVRTAQPGLLTLDLQLYTKGGEVVAAIQGLQVKAVAAQTLLGTAGWRDWLYQVNWQLQELPQQVPPPNLPQTRGGAVSSSVLSPFSPTPTLPKREGVVTPHETVPPLLGEARRGLFGEVSKCLPLKEGKGAVTAHWLLLADVGGLGEQVSALLRSTGAQVTVVTRAAHYAQLDAETFQLNPSAAADYRALLQAIPAVTAVLHGWSLDFRQPATATVAQLQQAAAVSCGSLLHLLHALADGGALPAFYLLTQSAVACGPQQALAGLAQSPLWGMGKVISLEYPATTCVCIDLDPNAAVVETAATLVAELTARPLTQPIATEEQIAYRHGMRYVARLATFTPTAQAEGYQWETAEKGRLDTLRRIALPRRQPAPGQVEIELFAAGLNFRDVLTALDLYPGNPGPMGLEGAGKIVAVAVGVDGFAIGDRVMAIAPGCFSRYLTVDARLVVRIPDGFSDVEAATIPSVFVTAWHCLQHLAAIKPGDRILIHTATGGIGQAAIQLAQLTGAEIFATASPTKWPVLKALGIRHIYNSRALDFAEAILADTAGRGVDIVLNTLTGPGFIEQSLAVLAANGTFLEISKRDVLTPVQMAAARPDVRYYLVDQAELLVQEPALVQQQLQTLASLFAQRKLMPIAQTIFAMRDMVSAFRTMQQATHTGKLVLLHPQARPVTIDAAATYLITGGLGGLGLVMARGLVEQGARRLLLISRRPPSAAAQRQLDELRQWGATVLTAPVDVADGAQMAELIAAIPQEHPLKGVIHAAGLLDDGLLVNQSWERFSRVLAPKLDGAWHLHQLTAALPLDFFVLFSSASSLLGLAGQANYAAANAFLDGLAHYRQSLGLPALAINWGVWGEIGSAAQFVPQLKAMGLEAILPQQGPAILNALLSEAPAQIGVVPINWNRFDAQRPFYANFRRATVALHGGNSAAIQETEEFLLAELKNKSLEEQKAHLAAHIQTEIASILRYATPDGISVQQGFRELGMDSLTSMELRNRLQSALDCPLPAAVIFNYPTVEALATYLLDAVLTSTTATPASVAQNGYHPADGAALSISSPPQPFTNGHNTNGHNTNGHNTNGHSTNGHSTNGHSTNGHSTNGHSTNGHSTNGHSTNGHSTNGHSHILLSPPAAARLDESLLMRERMVTVRGLALCLCEWGPADGQQVLCIHGTRDHGASWAGIATTLAAQGYHVIAPDLRGHGRSEHVGPYSQYQLRDFVSDLAQIVQVLGKQPVTLVGHSLGAIIAVLYATAYPAQVERLLLLEPPLSPLPEGTQSFAEEMATQLQAVDSLRQHAPLPDLQAAADRLRQVTPTLSPAVALRRAERLTQPQGDGVVWRWDARFDGQMQLDALFAGLRKTEYLALLAGIQSPLSVVYGDASGWISRAEKARIQSVRPTLQPVVLPGGHNLHLDAPDALAQVILQFSQPVRMIQQVVEASC